MSRSAIQRVEFAVDFAIIGMGGIVAVDAAGCWPAEKIGLRKAIYAASNAKDIRIDNGNVTCWGMAGAEEGLDQLIAAANKNPAANRSYQLFAVNADRWQGLGIGWNHSPGRNIIEVISTHNMLFDLLPAHLRDHATMDMELSDGSVFAAYRPESAGVPELAEVDTFQAQSKRFPIHFTLRLDHAAVAAWNNDPPGGFVAIALALTLIIGFLAARGIVREPSLLRELDHALANGEIRPYFQPIFDLGSRQLLGYEMLARWVKPDGSVIAPSGFIPLAENEGRIALVTQELLRLAGEQIGSFLHAHPDKKLTFNVTPDQFLTEGFAGQLFSDVVRFGLPTASMVVEITERQAIADLEKAAAVSAKLLESGISLAIDDAGTGHNGLSAIHGLGAQYLKIDKYFVDGLLLDKRSSSLIEMLVGLAREFSMTVVAEGIETDAQIEILKSLGINQGQGYVYSKPVPAEIALAMAATVHRRVEPAPVKLLRAG